MSLGNVFILGDSYSTFENFIPEGYHYYYSTKGRKETDVNRVEQTWWHPLLSDTGSNLLLNCSYSGTTICNTGYDGADYSEISFISRFDKLTGTDFFKENKVDTFFLFGGTNDSWAGAPVGNLMYSDWTKEDLYSVLPAFCYLLHRIKEPLPDAKVFCIINTELKQVIEDSFKTACKKYNINILHLKNIDKNCGHPTISGMKQIKEQILASI